MINKKSNKAAFTLIEVLIVVLILGILATLSMPSFEKVMLKARFTGALLIINYIEKEIDLIILETGLKTIETRTAAGIRLEALLASQPGLTFDSSTGLYNEKSGFFAYSIPSGSFFVGIIAYTRKPNLISLCGRVDWIHPEELIWVANIDNPYFKDILPMLNGYVHTI